MTGALPSRVLLTLPARERLASDEFGSLGKQG